MSILKSEDVKSLAVMGFGTMGHTWSTALLLGGLDVYVYEANSKAVEANKARVKGYLESLKKKGKCHCRPISNGNSMALIPN